MDVPHAAVRTGIAPGPTQTVIEHLETLAGRNLANGFGIL